MFRDAYTARRCIVPVDTFLEWRAIKGARAKQPFAIAMKDGSPLGLAGLWENWRNPGIGEWERTFVIITVTSNDLVAPNPRPHAGHSRAHQLRPLAGPQARSAQSSHHISIRAHDDVAHLPRVNSPENDDPRLLGKVEDSEL